MAEECGMPEDITHHFSTVKTFRQSILGKGDPEA